MANATTGIPPTACAPSTQHRIDLRLGVEHTWREADVVELPNATLVCPAFDDADVIQRSPRN
jgi:hypothetical protein